MLFSPSHDHQYTKQSLAAVILLTQFERSIFSGHRSQRRKKVEARGVGGEGLDGHSLRGIWLAEEVSDLYKDPANMYVPVSEMIVIAQAKIDGKVVDGLLLEQRKLVLESQKLQDGKKKIAKK